MRSFFSGLGFLFAVLAVFSASYLATLASDIDSHQADYEKLAVDVTRELSRTWTLADIEKHYAADAREELQPVLHQQLEDHRQLGELMTTHDGAVEPRWSHHFWEQVTSVGNLFERLADMANRSVRVTFTGRFKGGLADVTADLKREGTTMKLWRLRIDSREPPPPPTPRIISHA
jgi:hypothetical protein